jgi:hypothetical protein
MNYSAAREEAERMANGARDAACVVVNADGEWEPMWFGVWCGSHIPHVRVGWVSSNSYEANRINRLSATKWLDEQRAQERQ